MMNHGVVHFEIPANDPEKLSAFYTQLFGWQIQKMDMDGTPYHMVSTTEVDEKGAPKNPGAINGGIGPRMAANQQPMNYVNVESVDDYVAKAKILGATVIGEKMPIPGMGYFAQLQDREGNPFGVYQDSPGAS